MAIIKCKMCGGDLNIDVGKTVAECEYCGTRQTVPTADNEKKLTLFARANRLRAACEFDKAASVYESIVAEFPTEAEAYWGLVLCRYGIEYVDDPATGKKIPTCHRSSFESILEDPDFEQALENADAVSRKVYREEAKAIEDIRRRIVELSGKEQPYDVFICYKETDENGERTPDSVMAQEVYDALTEKGLRVFFSRITLEDKLGTEYEPYIFAALNSAKVMLVFGTDYEYFNAVWVKNEWSRFLALIALGQKKHLIPCYKGVDAYDMPKEFAHLQGQDMGKLGAVQDLVRGVEKLLGKGTAQTAQTTQPVIVQAAGGVSSDALLKRGNMALNDGNWKAADEFFDRVLDMNAECAEAWLGKFLARVQASDIAQYAQEKIDQAKREERSASKEAVKEDAARIDAAAQRFAVPGYLAEKDVRAQYTPPEPYRSVADYWRQAASLGKSRLASDGDLTKARNFATGALKERLAAEEKAFAARWDECVKQAERRDAQAKEAARKAYAQALDESDRKAEALCKAAEEKREGVYQELCREQAEAKTSFDFGRLAANFERLKDYKDSAARVQQCHEKAKELQARETAEKERAEREEAKKRKRKRIIAIIVVLLIAIAAVAAWYITQVFIPAKNYQAAEALYASGEYAQAAQAFEAMGGYEDAPERALASHYAHAEALLSNGEYDAALTAFTALGDYSDAPARIPAVHYAKAEALYANSDYEQAAQEFEAAGDYEDAPQRAQAAHYAHAEVLLAAGDDNGALAEFALAGNYQDAAKRIQAIHYANAEELLAAGDTDGAAAEFEAAGDYEDAPERAQAIRFALAEAMEAAGDLGAAAILYGQLGDYSNARERSFALWEQVADRETVSAGENHTVGLKSDGTVVAVGSNYFGQCDVADWTDIVAVSARNTHTVGLKSDGTVLAVGWNKFGQRYVADWTDIVAVSAGHGHTVGLKSDGTVLAVGRNDSGQCEVADWTDIVAVSAGLYHTVGLKSDGTVVAVGSNGSGRCDVAGWTDIVAVSAGLYHTVGLKSDGTVVAVGDNDYGQCDVADWTDIVAVSAGDLHTVGLKSDGTVVAVGDNDYGQCDVADWTDIVAVSAGGGFISSHTVGLKPDGTVVATEYTGDSEYYDGQCNVADWTDILVRQ